MSQDGVHPSASGEAKVAQQLQTFFNSSGLTSWYRDTPAAVPSAATAAAQAGAPASAGVPEIAPWIYAVAALAIGGAAAVMLRLTRRPR